MCVCVCVHVCVCVCVCVCVYLRKSESLFFVNGYLIEKKKYKGFVYLLYLISYLLTRRVNLSSMNVHFTSMQSSLVGWLFCFTAYQLFRSFNTELNFKQFSVINV